MPASSITYHHRGLYNNLSGIRLDKRSETLVLLGNGPSLREFDFAGLEGVDTLGMNAAYRYWDRINWYPTYYCCMDKVVIMSHDEEILRLIREQDQRHPAVLPPQDLRRRTRSAKQPGGGDHGERRRSSPAPAQGHHHGQLLGGSSARRSGIAGSPCSGSTAITSRQIKGKPAGDTKLVINEAPATNPNYFFDDYQQPGDVYNIPNVTPGSTRGRGSRRACADRGGGRGLQLQRSVAVTVFPFEDRARSRARRNRFRNRPRRSGRRSAGTSRPRSKGDFIQQAIGKDHADDDGRCRDAHGGSSVGFLKAGWRAWFRAGPDQPRTRD